MDTSLFHYEFPKELVAQHPLPERESSRMMVLDRKSSGRTDHHFHDLGQFLRPGDLLVFNNALADLVPVDGKLVPALPPYIKRKRVTDFTEEDYQRYRTVYASQPGSKAAPTAGFHFSESMLAQLKSQEVETRFLTLHVSYDTYKPIRSEKIEDHPMHGEEYSIPKETIDAITRVKKEKKRVIAVGTTVVRALESTTSPTRLFITPGYQFKTVDAMLTNFHRPRSTVLVMVSSFAGREFILAAYQKAIQERYRLFSYGDCMLIL